MKFRAVVVDDRGPDPALRRAVADLAARGLFVHLVNWRNSGFCASVNRGMRRARGRDVVLLNADTEVFDGWLDRLRAVAYGGDRIGTVTPLSNAATILSYPFFLADDHRRLEISSAELDALAASLDQPPVEIPTAIGFCMYIKAACLKDVGLFDTFRFGAGYGEENDFCRRAVERGWINVAAANVFVWHWGGRSFGQRKERLLAKAMTALDRRHPTYHATVADYISRDPLGPVRRRLDLARVRLKAPRPVLRDVQLRPGGPGRAASAVALVDHAGGEAWALHAAGVAAPNLPLLDPVNDPAGAEILLRDLEVSAIQLSRAVAAQPRGRALMALADDMGISRKSK